jgi:hypothetical protein
MPNSQTKTEIKASIGLLCLAGVLWNNKQSLEKLWGADGEGMEKFYLVMSQRRFKNPITRFLNKIELYPQNSLPFFSRNLECISEIHATMFILGALPMEGKTFLAAYNVCCVYENFLSIMFVRFEIKERYTLNVLNVCV